MPSKKHQAAADIGLPDIPRQLLDQFVTGPMTAEAIEAITRKFKKAIIEPALGAEMRHHLGYGLGEDKPDGVTNLKNTRRCRHPHCSDRWLERHAGSLVGGVSGHHTANLHRALDAQQLRLCQLERPQGAGSGIETDLHSGQCRGRQSAIVGI
jgi:hypothetical protein